MQQNLLRNGLISIPISLIVFLINSQEGKAQSLIQNSDFEQFTACPSLPDQISFAYPWFNPAIPPTPEDLVETQLPEFKITDTRLGHYYLPTDRFTIYEMRGRIAQSGSIANWAQGQKDLANAYQKGVDHAQTILLLAEGLGELALRLGGRLAVKTTEKVVEQSATKLLSQGMVPNAGGKIVSFTTKESSTFFRVYSGKP